jgi:hypothetical protein
MPERGATRDRSAVPERNASPDRGPSVVSTRAERAPERRVRAVDLEAENAPDRAERVVGTDRAVGPERRDRDSTERRPARAARARTESPGEAEHGVASLPERIIDESVVEVYASVGRRQGAKPSDYERQLSEAGVPAELVAYVRVRHRNAFVGVDKTAIDRALAALDGANIAGARVKAELSRGRSALVENDASEPLVED